MVYEQERENPSKIGAFRSSAHLVSSPRHGATSHVATSGQRVPKPACGSMLEALTLGRRGRSSARAGAAWQSPARRAPELWHAAPRRKACATLFHLWLAAPRKSMTSLPGAPVLCTGGTARTLLLIFVVSLGSRCALCQVSHYSKLSLPGAAFETIEEALKLKGPHRPPELQVPAPDDDMFPYSLHKVVPAVMVAVEYLQHHRNLTLVVNYNNTNCSSSHGPLLAFDHYIAGKVDVFLGPTCSYVLAPVARYNAEWDLPVLTSSGQNDNFDTKYPNYRLLTRMNGSFTQVGQLFIETLRRFGWQVVAFLFHEFRERTKGHSDCFFNLAAVFNALGGGHMFHQKFDEEDPSVDFEFLMQQVARNARSESLLDV